MIIFQIVFVKLLIFKNSNNSGGSFWIVLHVFYKKLSWSKTFPLVINKLIDLRDAREIRLSPDEIFFESFSSGGSSGLYVQEIIMARDDPIGS